MKAANLLQLLEGIDDLEDFRGQVEALGLDTPDINAAFVAAIGRAHLAAGAVAFPDGADHSRLISYLAGFVIFNRQTGRIEPIEATDPATVPLADTAVGGEIIADDVTEQPSASISLSEPLP